MGGLSSLAEVRRYLEARKEKYGPIVCKAILGRAEDVTDSSGAISQAHFGFVFADEAKKQDFEAYRSNPEDVAA